MQTVWMGLGVPSLGGRAGADGLEGLTPQSFPAVLPDTPSAPLQITLPVGTHQVWLWTDLDRVWYALDALLLVIPPPTQGGVLPATSFAEGAILMPGQWQAMAMDPAASHTLQLVSEAMSPTVYLTIWMESF